MIRPLKKYLISTLLTTCFAMNGVVAEEATLIEKYDADSVRFDNIKMKLDIKTNTTNKIEIKVFSPDEKEKLVKLKMSGNELVIDQIKSPRIGDVSVISHGTGYGGGQSVVSIGNQTTIVKGNHILVSHNGYRSRSRMEVSVPVGTPLTLNNFKGKAQIGDIESKFKMNGSGKIIAGKLNAVDLELERNAKIEIDRVQQDLKVRASGNSKLHLQQGEVDNMQADLIENSRVKYGGHAHKASLSVTDNGKLFIASVDERKNSSISRNGRLTIGNW